MKQKNKEWGSASLLFFVKLFIFFAYIVCNKQVANNQTVKIL